MSRPSAVGAMLRVALSFLLMSLAALAMLAVALVTLFQARVVYAERMPAWLGRAILRIWSIRLLIHQEGTIPRRQVIYVANHSSTLDMFALIALGLPRTRYFMFGGVRKFLPLALIGHLMGMFWTVDQRYPLRRRAIFGRADRVLRRTGDSAYLSPEGRRVTDGRIGPFNKGAFHLAISLRAPVVPLYIRIPDAINPGTGFWPAAGTIDVFIRPPISTEDWQLQSLDRHRDSVRDEYVALHQTLRHAGSESGVHAELVS